MISDLIDYWSGLAWRDKIALVKQFAIESAILLALGCVFFWSAFVFIWFITYVVGVQPYYHTSSPNFHVRNVLPDSLFTIYINPSMRQQACELGQNSPFFNEMTVPYHEYCNIEQLHLPRMRYPVDISVLDVEASNIAYVIGCIKHRGKEISCQKYQSVYDTILLFRSVDFDGLYYLQIQLQLKKMAGSNNEITKLSYNPQVYFEQKCWLVTKLIKKYYNLFSLFFTAGITAMLTLSVICYRLYKIVQNSYRNDKCQPKPAYRASRSEIYNTKNMSIPIAPNRSQVLVPVSQKSSNPSSSSQPADSANKNINLSTSKQQQKPQQKQVEQSMRKKKQ